MCHPQPMTERSEVAEKLKALRERADLSYRDMADEAGMSTSSYSHYELRFKKPYLPADKAEAFARALAKKGIPRSEVLALAGPGSGSDTPSVLVEDGDGAPDGAAMVPLYDVAASAGDGALVGSEDRIAHVAFNPDYLRTVINAVSTNLQVIKVQGESMEPTLRDGDLVMIDRTKCDLNFDGLFVLRFGDSLQVKRVNRSPERGHVEVISDNPAYGRRDWPVTELDPLGRVLWIGKRV